MKKLLSVILIIVLSCGLLSAFGAISVFAAEGDVEAIVWEPTEITFNSQKTYGNPYLDVEIDAVFTHTDGTQIKIPGFWKEKSTFAVRFTPTKTGTWTYTVSSNVNDEALSVTGSLEAKANTGETELDKHGFVKVEKDTTYFMYDDGTPFFWLADTHWQGFNYEQIDVCNFPGCQCYSQFKHEINDRVEKGFTVYQTYFDSAESDGGGQSGKLPGIWETYRDYSLPSSEVFNEKIDKMFEYLHENGMSIALGFGVHASTPAKMTFDQIKPFIRYCVARYGCYSIVWITAQEITRNDPTGAEPDYSIMQYWMEIARYVNAIDGYKHAGSAHMDVIDALDGRSITLSKEEWHNCWASQGGHGPRLLSKKSRYQAYCTYNEPVWEAEYNYEDINCGGFASYDLVRYGAWNAMMNGLAGYTYGTTGIWANCYSNEKLTGWYGATSSYNYEPWYMGLGKPGSYEMTYMKNFFETLPDWSKLKARYYDTTYASFLAEETQLLSSTDDSSVIVSYFRSTVTNATGTVYKLDASKTYHALWFNPRTGRFIEVDSAISGVTQYDLPEKPDKWDWIFLLTSEELKPYYTEEMYVDPTPAEDVGSIVTPYKVTAVGGIYSSNGRVQNLTSYLYDLDGVMAWEPLAQRATQTIIYDLGVAYNLTQINIVPVTGTKLPGFRIEGSNDNKMWTIISNATIRDPKMSEDGTYVSEALTGAYRYVKILFVSPKDLTRQEINDADYKLFYNPMGEVTYSHTAIAEISVFATDAAEKVVVNQPVTGPVTTPTVIEGESTVEMKALPIAICAVAGIAIGTVVAVVVTIKKKEQ